MNKDMNSEQSALYRAPDFRRRVSFALACEQSDVDVAIHRLLAAGRIPMVGQGIPADIAIWADAARLLAAVAGQ
ncbi:hypothetical protein [Mesorhizobium sp.]|uniref:hypothetical protein n=1 Tax=Mesorhizobium sp. TaxID=1871066 RepID=UPI0025E80106|nr:hypothetical protein [Mesorhizobium sp.]